ncbi:MAG TPA: Trm112 family protein [Egibacteraceae bacterium]|nr:Trm112 family protein [Actinomycetota bacterium]HWB72026.1 Trm112 family protein [Egibacteraceae bacterium]
MAVDPELIDLLVCPDCHGEIEYKDRRKVIICTRCGLHYPVRDDIPVMLVEEATRPEARRPGAGGQPPPAP